MRWLERLRDRVEAHPRRALVVGALIFVLGAWAWDAREAIAQTAGYYGRGIVRVLTAGTYEPSGVSEINFGSGLSTSRSAGRLTVTASGGGGGSGLPDGGPDNAIVRADGISTAIQTSQVTIDDTGSVALVSGATVDGYDVSALGVTVSALPAQSLSATMANPADAGSLRGTYRGQGLTYNADAGFSIAACTVTLPANSVCRYRFTAYAKQVGDASTGLTPSAHSVLARWITHRTDATSIVATTFTPAETDVTGVTGATAGVDAGAGPTSIPWVQGAAGAFVWWSCEIDLLSCNSI